MQRRIRITARRTRWNSHARRLGRRHPGPARGPGLSSRGIIDRCRDFLPSQGFGDVADAEPEHADRRRVAAGLLVVDGQLDFVGLVDQDLKVFVPLVVSARVGDAALVALDFDHDACFVVNF